MKIGYARTSTVDQIAGLDDQKAELAAAGCEKIFAEHGSGIDSDRPELGRALDYLRDGDVLVVTKPDRVARSARDLLDIVHKARGKGAGVHILSMGIDTTISAGRLMLTVLAGMAEFERDIMLERQRAGIAAAKAAGKYKGRAPKARNQAAQIAAMRAAGKTGAEVAAILGISMRSVYRHSV